VHLTAPRDVPSQRTKRARLPGSRLEGASPTCNCLDGGPLERRCQQNSVLWDGREARAVESAEQFCAATGVGIRHSGSMAYRAHGPDVIQLPVREVFRDSESYAAIQARKLTYWSTAGRAPLPPLLQRFISEAGCVGSEAPAQQMGSSLLMRPSWTPCALGRRRERRTTRKRQGVTSKASTTMNASVAAGFLVPVGSIIRMWRSAVSPVLEKSTACSCSAGA